MTASLLCLPVFSQLDLKEKAQLIGIQIEDKKGATEQEMLSDVSFIFISQPSAFYHQRKDSLVTIEFYDATLGEEPIPSIIQSPFVNSWVSVDKVDVNAGIEGLKADFKDVVRVSLEIEKGIDIDFTMSQDFNVFTLATVWSKTGKTATTLTQKKSNKKAWIWMAGGSAVLIGGVVGVLLIANDDGDGTKTAVWPVPAPPSLPPAPAN